MDAITGGPGSGTLPTAELNRRALGVYRSAGHLQRFFANVGVEFRMPMGGGSRMSAVRATLQEVNARPHGLDTMREIIEAACDPSQGVEAAERVVKHLERLLAADGYRLLRDRDRYRLVTVGANAPVLDALRQVSEYLDFDAVGRHFNRALAQADVDPEDAVTAACGILESVCKSLLDELGAPYPAKEDVSGLVREIQKQLALAPDRPDLVDDARRILNGLTTAAGGLGALRTHAGDAHGQGKNVARVTPALARLAIHAASTVALFFIETWQSRQS